MNGTIIGGVVFIGAASVANSVLHHRPITPILIGSFFLMLLLAILEFFGGVGNQFAQALVSLAVIVTVLDIMPWQAILTALGVHQ